MSSILDLLLAAADQRPSAPALLAPGRDALDHRSLLRRIDDVHRHLAAHGIGPGDPVVLVMPDGPEMAIACLATATGATCCPVNPTARRAELEFAFDDLRPRALLTMPGLSPAAAQLAAERAVPVLEVVADPARPAGWFELRSQVPAALSPAPRAAATVDDVALILHTSGTTARAKAVPLTHGNICATAANLARAVALDEHDTCLNLMPMFHVGALVDLLVPPLATGGAVVCGGTFDASQLPALIRDFRPTWLQVVPAMASEVLARFGACPREFVQSGSLRVVRAVAAAVPPALVAEFEAAFGVPLLEVYGMTETATLIASNPLPPAPRKPGSVGRPAGPEVAILGDDGRLLPSPQRGEVVVRGPSVMHGYRNDPAANARSFVDGWFRTGDVGWLDADGDLFLVGRIKEIVNRGGEKVSPAEVDEVLRACPGVADAGAFGVPHPTLGEDVAAAVVPAVGTTLDERTVVAFAAERLAWFKVPRRVFFVDALPRTTTGKLRRAALAESLADATPGDVRAARAEHAAAPGSALEATLARMWTRILEIDHAGPADSFFDLGGDSLRAAVFVNELQQRTDEPLLVSAVFDAPTLAEFAALLQREHPAAAQKLLGEPAPVADAPSLGEPVTAARRREFLSQVVPLDTVRATPPRRNPRAIFLLCPPRSGSTLLRVMLAGNPQLFAPPELYLLPYHDLAARKAAFTGAQRGHLEGNLRALMQLHDCDAARAKTMMAELERAGTTVHDYFGMLQQQAGDRLVIDKTPFNCAHPETLQKMEQHFDEPLYVHLVRHPSAMIRSWQQMRMEQLWWPRLTGQQYAGDHRCPYDSATMGEFVWTTVHGNACELLAGVPTKRWHRLAYEDLVRHPEQQLRALCAFLGVPFDADMLDVHADPRRRMTDGIHEVSQMIGDVKFLRQQTINAANADAWRADTSADRLGAETRALAASLGYHELAADAAATAASREQFDF